MERHNRIGSTFSWRTHRLFAFSKSGFEDSPMRCKFLVASASGLVMGNET